MAWKQHEIDKLKAMKADRKSVNQISDALCRSVKSVRYMQRKLKCYHPDVTITKDGAADRRMA